eukprot:Awhi_evm1s12895
MFTFPLPHNFNEISAKELPSQHVESNGVAQANAEIKSLDSEQPPIQSQPEQSKLEQSQLEQSQPEQSQSEPSQPESSQPSQPEP